MTGTVNGVKVTLCIPFTEENDSVKCTALSKIASLIYALRSVSRVAAIAAAIPLTVGTALIPPGLSNVC